MNLQKGCCFILSYAHALFCQREKEINIDRQNQLRHILATTSPTNPRIAEITDLLYEKHRLLMLAKVESYLAAYRIFGFALDHEDEHAVSNELLNIATDQLNFVLRLEGVNEHRMPKGNRSIDNVPQYLMDRFHIARDQAINRLQAGKIELIAEARKKKMREDKLKSDSNQINIHGPNYGAVQQGGNSNAQTVSITIHTDLDNRIQQLLHLVEGSNLSYQQKSSVVTDIKRIQDLGKFEISPEVVEEANSRLTAIEKVLAVTADVLTIAAPIILGIRLCFGI